MPNESNTLFEAARVETRDIIADITHPITFLRDSFSRVATSFHNGDMIGVFKSVFSHGAAKMLEEVKDRCPVHYGTLRDSLHVTTEDETDWHGSKRASSLSVHNVFAYVTTDDPVAEFLEYGTRKMAAHPFMRPALDSGRFSTIAWIGDIITTHVMSGFVGRLALDLGDIALAHMGTTKQKHGIVRDLAVHAAKALVIHKVGKIARRAGGKVIGKLKGPGN